MIRLVHLLRCRSDLSTEAFTTYWRDVHGPLVAGLQSPLGLVRHVQLHPDPADQGLDRAAMLARGGMQPSFDGVAETWWRSAEALHAALESDAGNAAFVMLAESEREFLDPGASPLWLAREYPQVSAQLGRTVASWRSGIVRIHFALNPHAHLGDEGGRRYWLTQHGPLVRSHALARGLLAYNQVHRDDAPEAAGLTAQLAALHGSNAPNYLGHAEAWFDRISGQGGPERDAAASAALADEREFIDWDRSTIVVGKDIVFVDRDWA
jgi:hypothetical protein